MEHSKSTLEVIQEWKRKCCELSSKHTDPMITAVTKGFEAVEVFVSNKTDFENIQRVLAYSNVERSLSLKFDKVKNDYARDLAYGLLEIVHLILRDVSEEMNQVKETGEIYNRNFSQPIEPKEEPMEGHVGEVDPIDNQLFDLDFMGDIKEEELTNDYVNSQMDDAQVPRDELINSIGNDLLGDEGEMEKDSDNTAYSQKNSSKNTDEKEGRKSSRRVFELLNCNDDCDDSDHDFVPNVKKSRNVPNIDRRKSSNVVSGKSQKKSEVKLSDTEIECPECEYRTRSVSAWVMHLRLKHSTTPNLSGLALLCECGHESTSKNHYIKCTVANFTVIRKRDGPIRRFNDEKVTPQCILCEMYPKTVLGYAHHLRVHHNSTLQENNIYLKCSCGLEVHSEHNGQDKSKHGKECDPCRFTQHKSDGK